MGKLRVLLHALVTLSFQIAGQPPPPYTLHIASLPNPLIIPAHTEPWDAVSTYAKFNGLVDDEKLQVLNQVCSDLHCRRSKPAVVLFDLTLSYRPPKALPSGDSPGEEGDEWKKLVVPVEDIDDEESVTERACLRLPSCWRAEDTSARTELLFEVTRQMDAFIEQRTRSACFYTRLGLDKVGAPPTTEQVKKAFRALSLKYHPDRGGDGELFLLVSEAADVLGNEERRKEYDLNRGIVREERRGRGGYHHQFDGRNGRPKVEVYGDFKMKVDEFGNMEIYV